MSESKNDSPAEVEKNLLLTNVLEKALDEELAKARSNEAATADAGVPAPSFVVHTKHSCDVCFQQPIIGKRYTSSDRKNFDLCARCFDAYSGPEIGLEEAVLGKCSHDNNSVTDRAYYPYYVPLSSSPQPVTRSTALRSC